MLKSSYFIIIIFFALSVSCGDNPSGFTDGDRDNTIFVSDSVQINISSDEFFRSIQNHVVYQNQKTFLVRESRLKTSIEIYDWEARKKHGRISFQNDGPNSLRNFGSAALYPFHLDSIFIANLAGDLYFTKRDSILQIQPNSKGFRFFGESSYKPAKIGNKIFLHNGSNFRQMEPDFYDDFAVVAYDLDNGQLEAIPVEFPDRFRNNCWAEVHWYVPFTTNNKGQVVISFSTGPEIKVYDPDTKTVIANHEVKSIFAEKIEPLPNCETNDLENYFRYLKTTPRYLSLTYDPFKNVYYRMIALPVSGNPDGQGNFQNVQPLSLMVLDHNFGVIGEKMFPGRKYDSLDFFVTEEGLWLSRSNEEAEDFDENRLFYDLIDFERSDEIL